MAYLDLYMARLNVFIIHEIFLRVSNPTSIAPTAFVISTWHLQMDRITSPLVYLHVASAAIAAPMPEYSET